MPTGFFPAMDGGRIRITTRAEESISFTALAEAQRGLHPIIAADPAVDSYLSTVGGGTRGETNSGNITVRLKPIKERDHIDVVINRLRAALGDNPTLNVYVQNADSRGAGGSGGQYTYTLVGTDSADLYPAAQKLEKALKGTASVRDVGTDLQLMNPTIRLDIDRDKAGMLGITLRQIENALYSAFGTRQISTIYTDVSDYTVKLEVLPDLQDSASVLSSIYLRSDRGALVPLDTLGHLQKRGRPPDRQPSGAVPRRERQLQYLSRLRHGRRHAGCGGHGGNHSARYRDRQLHRNRPGLPVLCRQHDPADHRGSGAHLYCTRHSV